MHETPGDRLRQAREAAGLSARQAASLMDCSHVWIGEMERGDKAVPSEWAVRLADLYGVSTDFLLRGVRAKVPADIERGLAKLPIEGARAIRTLIGMLAVPAKESE